MDIVLFDLDGTLIDISEIVIEAYDAALKKLGYPSPEREAIGSLAGRSTYKTAEGLVTVHPPLNKQLYVP